MTVRGALITSIWVMGAVWFSETGLRANVALTVVAMAMALVTRGGYR
jgi:hypothetical protein